MSGGTYTSFLSQYHTNKTIIHLPELHINNIDKENFCKCIIIMFCVLCLTSVIQLFTIYIDAFLICSYTKLILHVFFDVHSSLVASATYWQNKVTFLFTASDLDSIRALFNEKEKELSLAVAKVEELTRQLEELRRGRSSTTRDQTPPASALELDKLRRELMVRYLKP